VQCGAQNVECCINISACKFHSTSDHIGHLVLMPEGHLWHSENVFNFVFFLRNSDFLDDLASKYSSGGPYFVP
jgi:hypothetical protein